MTQMCRTAYSTPSGLYLNSHSFDAPVATRDMYFFDPQFFPPLSVFFPFSFLISLLFFPILFFLLKFFFFFKRCRRLFPVVFFGIYTYRNLSILIQYTFCFIHFKKEERKIMKCLLIIIGVACDNYLLCAL